MRIPIFQLTEADRDSYVDNCGIHGSELTNMPVPAVDEYDSNVRWLFEELKAFGKNGAGDEHPYFLDEWSNPTCFPAVEIADAMIAERELVVAVHRAVFRMAPNYRVHIVNASGFLDDEFDVFVEKERIYVYAPVEPYVRKLGLNRAELAY